MRIERVLTVPGRERSTDRQRPDQNPYQNQTPRDPPGPVLQAAAWQRALRVVRGQLN
jgi:hypothetical protein